MILKTLFVEASELEQRTGWAIKPQGACKHELCVPLPVSSDLERVDVQMLASQLHMPLLHDKTYDVWCLGPEAGGNVLNSALLPEIVLADLENKPFALRDLRGQKVLLVTWASW
jgi:hypothetical protein